jgi:acetyl-CoA acetyltransferase family protein
MDAARAIMCGEGEIYIAGGVESMTRAPFVMAKSSNAWNRQADVFDTTIGWRFINKRLTDLYFPFSMGETAENVAKQWKISREEQDRFALHSQEKYFNALNDGKWKDEITRVEILGGKNEKIFFEKDEPPRDTSMEKLASLKPAFIKDGSVTAGNSSGINDGAAALLLASEDAVKKFNLKPMVSLRSMAVAGVDPSVMGIGPVPASNKALKRAQLSIKDLALVELNEAFSVVGIVNIRKMNLDAAKVNVHGGAVSLGHPLGCSGARIIVTLINVLKQHGGKLGVAGICNGGGGASAMVIENVA